MAPDGKRSIGVLDASAHAKQGKHSDVVTTTKSGIMIAYEVTMTATHLMGNSSKYAHSNYAKIVWLCRDHNLVQAVKGFFRESVLPTDLLARFEYLHFSGLVKQQRQMFNY